jgi:hypothetical protein
MMALGDGSSLTVIDRATARNLGDCRYVAVEEFWMRTVGAGERE